MYTEFKTIVRGKPVYIGSNLEEAIREWDRHTWDNNLPKIGDGISVQQWDQDSMVRDGYLLHINSYGAPYLNPQIAKLKED